MTIVRREHRAQFTIVPNAVFADSRLSVEAKGVLGYLLSRPHKWHVRLDHIGRTLLVGRKKLQRIFRELIAAGYVTREAQRIVDGHRFGEIDYVVCDVPAPVNKSARPRGRKGPAAPRVQKGPAYKDSPQGPEGPAYKELYKNRPDLLGSRVLDGRPNVVGVTHDGMADLQDDARLDLGIVALFNDVAEGWELIAALPDPARDELRQRYRRGELDRFAIMELRTRYRHLLGGGRPKGR
ncbi:hypothetical protein HL666_19980 [Bradyrhizobium sp. 83002]|uniref:hypothetical protein n=1 Tax=Bradyrhizobium aeschynomenes TaxID=2734909 RepID=UPI0015540883|nr:hypothetical protein [Bradyrhizobium aeschynomenes]NPU13054.1 hypothetical protein [Bradyrhizobium aeschynomenes]